MPIENSAGINLKTAKTLSPEVPPMLLARADEVIESIWIRLLRLLTAGYGTEEAS